MLLPETVQPRPIVLAFLLSETCSRRDVIYAQLTLQQRGFMPSSLSTKDVPTEPSVYMEFKVNQAHAEARPGPGL